jgi:ribosomal protein L37E
MWLVPTSPKPEIHSPAHSQISRSSTSKTASYHRSLSPTTKVIPPQRSPSTALDDTNLVQQSNRQNEYVTNSPNRDAPPRLDFPFRPSPSIKPRHSRLSGLCTTPLHIQTYPTTALDPCGTLLLTCNTAKGTSSFGKRYAFHPPPRQHSPVLTFARQPHQDPRSLQTLRVSRPRTRKHDTDEPRPHDDGPMLREMEVDHERLNSSRRSLHNQKKTCSSCGYPAAKIRKCTSQPPGEDFTSSRYPGAGASGANMAGLQTTGPRRRSAERLPAPAACVTSARSRESSRTASRLATKRARGDPTPPPHERGLAGQRLMRTGTRDCGGRANPTWASGVQGLDFGTDLQPGMMLRGNLVHGLHQAEGHAKMA